MIEFKNGKLIVDDCINAIESITDKVDFVYLDPPYNTGNDFGYNDKFSNVDYNIFIESLLSKLTKKLADDYILFISINDKSLFTLLNNCYKILGDDDFIGIFKWKKTDNISYLTNKIAYYHENIICFSGNRKLKLKRKVDIESSNRPLVNKTNKINDLVIPKDIIEIRLEDGVYKEAKHECLTLLKDVHVKNGKLLEDLHIRGPFRLSQNYINTHMPKIYIKTESFYMLDEKRLTLITVSDLIDKNVGVPTTKRAKIELNKIKDKLNLNHITFDTPKPVELLQYLLNISLYEKDNQVILDCFGGSGATAVAVVRNNEINKTNNKFIIIQKPENDIEKLTEAVIRYEENKK